jgi:ElaB/YqjD/DUF883 family membrane-anchored ribosome-binding protein
MKSMTEFTNEQLKVMSKESTPRGKAARQELERRADKEPSKKVDTAKQEVVESSTENVEVTEEVIEEAPAKKPTRSRKVRKQTTKED